MTAKKATTVATIQPKAIAQQAVHPGAMIQALMAAPDVDVDKLEKMFELQTKFEENQARKEYHAAMAMFGALVPVLKYDSWVTFKSKDGKVDTDYGFASLAGSMKKLQEAMDQCSLKASWKTETKGDSGYTQVTCYMTHGMGHSESTSLSALPDPSGGKNSIQAVKSTVSYLKRITFEAIAGLARCLTMPTMAPTARSLRRSSAHSSCAASPPRSRRSVPMRRRSWSCSSARPWQT